MLVYLSEFAEFSEKVLHNHIVGDLQDSVYQKLGHGVGQAEVKSWQNSLPYVRNALEVSGLPSDAGIAIEFQIPLTSKRIDVLVSGSNGDDSKEVIIIELKQWQQVEPTDKAGVVKTILGGSLVETTHPSYQAWSYATFIAVQRGCTAEFDSTTSL